jgi:hypothetical protein
MRRSRRSTASLLGRIAGAAAVLAFASPANAQLLHHYSFNTPGAATDGAGSANGTLLGGATVAGGVLTLDGLNDYVQFGSHIVPTSSSYTVSLFARQAANAPNYYGYSEFISQGSSGGPGFYIGTQGAGNGSGLRATDSWIPAPGSFAADGVFHLYTLVVDAAANDSYFYIDGVLKGQRGFAIQTTTGGTDTRLGNQFGGYDEWFRGDLDDVRIYGNALSAANVQALAAGGPVTSAPEPASAVMLVTGLAGLVAVARRRRSS